MLLGDLMYNMNTDLILDKYIFSYDEVNEFLIIF